MLIFTPVKKFSPVTSSDKKRKPDDSSASIDVSVKGGRKKGSKNLVIDEVMAMLTIINKIIPVGGWKWEYVSSQLYGCQLCLTKQCKICTAKSCKDKFITLAFNNPPTGQASLSIPVKCKKEIKENVDNNECIGYAAGNYLADDIDDLTSNSSQDKIISGLSAFDASGRLSVTKK